jgi:hypothetical protein
MKSAINSHFKSWASGGMVATPVLGTGHASGEGSSPFSPTKNVDKNVYSVVYDKSTLSTIAKMESVVYKEKQLGSGLRNQCFFVVKVRVLFALPNYYYESHCRKY